MIIYRKKKKKKELPIDSIISNAILMRPENNNGSIKVFDLSKLQGYSLSAKLSKTSYI